MTNREKYAPGTAHGAEVRKDGDKWTLVLVRDLRHPPEKVWKALTEPEQLREWAPYDADRNLGASGTATLTTVGAPTPHVTQTTITRADAPRVLEFNWGGQDIRWELAPLPGNGTRLTLWHNIDRRFIAMGAAGWHICLDVLDHALAGEPIGRMVAGDAMKFDGWQRLHAEYAKQFGVETPGWSTPHVPEAVTMNILLWIVQTMLALHTVAGAVWKFGNSEQTVPSLRAIPHGMWLTLSLVELLCAVGLVLPAFNRRLARLAPLAAICVAAEMLLFCGLHLRSGGTDQGELIYWLVVAAVCAFVAWGRLVSQPLDAPRAAAKESGAAAA